VSKTRLKKRLTEGLFLLDGAMGTQVIAQGIEPGKCNELINLESPGLILRIHNAYLEAGSDAIITNTFGGNGFTLTRHGLLRRMADINTSAVNVAKKAAGGTKYVLGNIGPSGDFLEPVGHLKPDQLVTTFGSQAKALVAGGIDGFIIETMSAIDEAVLALKAAKSAGGDLPILASMAFDKRGNSFRTMMGIDVKHAVSALIAAGADAVGFNCGTATLDDYVELAKKYVTVVKATKKDVLIFAEPNAGMPLVVDGKAEYKVIPDEFASAGKKIYDAGVTIIGGCCGTGPEHIKALSEKLRG
jgi:5-methyltetrahydrofolate--homocysteine methyltransferase